MTSLLSLFLAALAPFADGNAKAASSPVDAIAQALRDDPKARDEAGDRLESFLLDADAEGRSFVDPGADRAALAAVARGWGRKEAPGRLAVLLFVSTPKTHAEPRLRAALRNWTEGGRIKKEAPVESAVAFLSAAADEAAKVYADPRTRAEIDLAVQSADRDGTAIPGTREASERARRLREARERRGSGDAGVFGPDRTAQELGTAGGTGGTGGTGGMSGGRPSPGAEVGGGRKSPEEMAALIASLNEAHRQGRDRQKVGAVSGQVPAPTEFQSLGSAEVAPAPGALDRAASLAQRDAPTVAADLRQIRDSLKDAELPAVQGLTESNPDAIRQFFQWLRTASEADMPAIDYTILPKGEVGHYELGLVSKGDIKVNHFIRNEPANARASVVVHELYHYWDKKVARNYYPNVSYGQIDPASKHVHEYDAYLATALYWQMVKKEGDSSPLARLLDRIPTEPGQVRELVNGAVGGAR